MLATFRSLLRRKPGNESPPAPSDPGLELELAARRSTAEYIMGRMRQAVLCSSRDEVLDLAVRHVAGDGLVCEFGVFEGQTINRIAGLVPDRTVFGFDSFEGLPEHWRGPFQRGVFSTGGRLPDVRPNVRLIKGWFDVTLPRFAAEHAGPAALLFIDCDLYSSTKCIFESLGGRVVPGSVIVFDEYFDYPGWEQHEFRAFAEFVARARLTYEYLAYNRLHEQVAVRITGRAGRGSGSRGEG
jgi:Macrocin-O-methyltransferase (TylF)